MDAQKSAVDRAAAGARNAYKALSEVQSYLQAVQNAGNIHAGTSLSLPLFDTASAVIDRYQQYMADQACTFASNPTEVIATYANFANIFQRLRRQIMELCLHLLPQFLENVSEILQKLLTTANQQIDRDLRGAVEVRKQLNNGPLIAVSQMQIRQGFRGKLDLSDLRELCTVFLVIQEAHKKLVEAPKLQRRQRERVRVQGQPRLKTLAKRLDHAREALAYLNEYSFLPPDDYTHDFARAQNLRPAIEGKLQLLWDLSAPGQTEWQEFEAELTHIKALYQQAQDLCDGILSKATELKKAITLLHGRIKWVDAEIRKLRGRLKGRRSNPTNPLQRLRQVELRLEKFVAFAAQPKPRWPDPVAATRAVESLRLIIQKIDRGTRGSYKAQAAALEALDRQIDFSPIDALLSLLAPPDESSP